MRILVLTLLVLSSCFGVDGQFTSPTFSINAPSGTGEGPGMVTSLHLPPKNGFSGNVNVTIQEYPGSLKDYDDLTQAQFKQANLTVISADVRDDQITYEYTGKMGRYDLHWYVLVKNSNGKIFLITATGLAIDWAVQGAALKKSVDSFTLTK